MTLFLPDTNVWLALSLDWHPAHSKAVVWWDGLSTGDGVLLCRPVQLSLLRLLTTRAVFTTGGAEPLTNIEAWAVVDEIAGDPLVEMAVFEPVETFKIWRASSGVATASPKMWMDAYLSAWAKAADAVLVTNDRALSASHGGEVVVVQ